MFVNYWADETRQTAFSLFVVRAMTVVYAIWKIASYEWAVLLEWPSFIYETGGEAFLVPAPFVLELLGLELAVIVLLLFGVLIGYRLRLTAVLASLLIAHVSGVHHIVTNQSITFLPLVYLLLLFAVFSDYDVVTVDEYRRTRSTPLDDLNRFLKGDLARTYRFPQLKWLLIVVALTYLFTGYGKLVTTGPSWMAADSIGRFVQMEILMHLGYPPVGGTLLVTNDALGLLAGVGTVVLEVGFILTVLTGYLYSPFILGLLGLHTGIAIWMHVFFFDQYLIFALFLPWDRYANRLAGESTLVVLYDDRCHFCVRVLSILKHLDTGGTVRFGGPDDLDDAYLDREGVRPEDAMYVFDGEDQFEGYWAFRHLLDHLGFAGPLVRFMGWGPVVNVGDRIYRTIAANRSRYFTCAMEAGP